MVKRQASQSAGTFGSDSMQELYSCLYKFLIKLFLGLKTRADV